GLVIGFDEIGAVVLALGQRHDIVQGPRLVGRRRQGALAHAAGARPSELAQEHLLVRKGGDDLLADGIDMARGVAGRDRKVLPVRQDVDGDEVDRARYLAIAQPELPYVRIGHRHRYLRFDLADGAGELWRRHLAAQQHLVADDHRRDDVGIPLGERDRALDLLAAQVGNTRQPQPLHHLDAVAAANLTDLT